MEWNQGEIKEEDYEKKNELQAYLHFPQVTRDTNWGRGGRTVYVFNFQEGKKERWVRRTIFHYDH